jgi:hypothetical protein
VVGGEEKLHETGATSQGHWDVSLERVRCEVEQSEPTKMAQVQRYMSCEAVPPEVEDTEVREVAQRRGHTARQTEGVEAQRDDPIAVPAAAAPDAAPFARVAGAVPRKK